MKKIIQNIAGIILALAAVALLFFALLAGLEKQAEVRCIKLQTNAEQFSLFYITESDDNYCQSIGIKIDTTVRDVHGEIIR